MLINKCASLAFSLGNGINDDIDQPTMAFNLGITLLNNQMMVYFQRNKLLKKKTTLINYNYSSKTLQYTI